MGGHGMSRGNFNPSPVYFGANSLRTLLETFVSRCPVSFEDFNYTKKTLEIAVIDMIYKAGLRKSQPNWAIRPQNIF
jgi:hypothetical protein